MRWIWFWQPYNRATQWRSLIDSFNKSLWLRQQKHLSHNLIFRTDRHYIWPTKFSMKTTLSRAPCQCFSRHRIFMKLLSQNWIWNAFKSTAWCFRAKNALTFHPHSKFVTSTQLLPLSCVCIRMCTYVGSRKHCFLPLYCMHVSQNAAQKLRNYGRSKRDRDGIDRASEWMFSLNTFEVRVNNASSCQRNPTHIKSQFIVWCVNKGAARRFHSKHNIALYFMHIKCVLYVAGAFNW